MHQHRIVHGFDQALEQLLAILEPRAALLQIFEQLVDRAAQLPERLGLPSIPMRPPAARRRARAFELLREFVDGALLAALPDEEHADAHGQDS